MKAFKVCPKCEHEWKTRDDFLNDASIRLIGFQASYDPSDRGFYLFNHLSQNEGCNTSLAVNVENFVSLYNGPMYEDVRAGSEVCRGHCATIDDLAKCDAPCKNAVARDIMLRVFKL